MSHLSLLVVLVLMGTDPPTRQYASQHNWDASSALTLIIARVVIVQFVVEGRGQFVLGGDDTHCKLFTLESLQAVVLMAPFANLWSQSSGAALRTVLFAASRGLDV